MINDTVVTLREYMEALLRALERRQDDRFRAQEEAVKLALAAQNDYTGKIMGAIAILLALFALFKH